MAVQAPLLPGADDPQHECWHRDGDHALGHAASVENETTVGDDRQRTLDPHAPPIRTRATTRAFNPSTDNREDLARRFQFGPPMRPAGPTWGRPQNAPSPGLAEPRPLGGLLAHALAGAGGTRHRATPRPHQRPNSLSHETRTGLCFLRDRLGSGCKTLASGCRRSRRSDGYDYPRREGLAHPPGQTLNSRGTAPLGGDPAEARVALSWRPTLAPDAESTSASSCPPPDLDRSSPDLHD